VVATVRSVLTERELEVVRLIARGKTNREVGEKLYISEETVKSHVRHIISKLRAENRTHAVAIVAMNAPNLLR
jgi:DNA-binding CsgD family transcriptional regulator